MNQNNRNFIIWAAIAGGLFFIFQLLPSGSNKPVGRDFAFSEFLTEVKQGKIKEVHIKGNNIQGERYDGSQFITYAPNDPQLVSRLSEASVRIKASALEDQLPSFWQALLSWFPLLLLIGFFFLTMRQLQSGGNKAMGFGKSRARLLGEKGPKVTFQDVAGIDEAREELEEIVDFLRSPAKFQRLGGRIPKGVLLVGPPGTGKTLLARSIAGEANVPFFSISGSDFVEMFVGVGASRVRDMFEQAKKNAPCIVFIDEIDAVGRHRGAGVGGGNDEREQTLNQLLVEMDGFEENEGIIIIAATNRPDVLDRALLRPGRFDRQIQVPNPDINGREKILNVHVRKVPLSPNVDLRIIARGTPGFSGADLRNLVNEAALLAARGGHLAVTMEDFEKAKDKVMMGAERRSMVMSDKEKKLTAYHEAGHAIVAHYTTHSDPIHKATIIPRGNALGMVMRLPEGDRISMSRAKLHADLMVAMGGRIAEEIIFGVNEVTTGAMSDIRMATNIAKAMINEWGLSKDLGFRSFDDGDSRAYGMSNGNISEETLKKIDAEVSNLLDGCYKQTYKLLESKKNKLELLAKSLLEYETLTGDEIRLLLDKGIEPTPENHDKSLRKKTTMPSTEAAVDEKSQQSQKASAVEENLASSDKPKRIVKKKSDANKIDKAD